MHEVNWRGSSLKPLKCMEETNSRHKRSKSDTPRRRVEEDKLENFFEASHRLKLDMGQLKNSVETKKRQSSNTELQNSLKAEIFQLQKRLQDQFVVRHALEKALEYNSFSHDPTNEIPMLKPAKDLMKEIAVLELQVVYLEQYLLSLYRKKFDRVSSLSTMDERLQSTSIRRKVMFSEVAGHDIILKNINSVDHSCPLQPSRNSIDNPPKECSGIWGAQKLSDSSIHRSHSSLSQRSACSIRTSPPMGIVDEAVFSYHSLPLSMLERAQGTTSNLTSLAEHLGTCISEHVPETSNWLSEEMIKCISAIYCKLADPSLNNHDYCSSPISLSSSMNEFSPQGRCDAWSPESRKYSFFYSNLDNPFHIEGSKEFSGPYCTMVEVQWICRDSKKLRDIEPILKSFRSLVGRLEEVDPRKMKHEEKLAFWINVHNALVMHAFLVYGIPQNNLKRMSLILKAAYNVGGQTISVDMIQRYILGCRLPRPGQWFRLLFSPKMKFKVGDPRRLYAIEHREPLLHFSLCSGSHSDPALRMYTPKNVFQELEAAKEEYIQLTLSVHKEQKVLLPKIVESFSKDSDMCPAGLVEMIEHFMPDSLRKSIQKCQRGKFWKSIEWTPHNFTFRYLLSKELAK